MRFKLATVLNSKHTHARTRANGHSEFPTNTHQHPHTKQVCMCAYTASINLVGDGDVDDLNIQKPPTDNAGPVFTIHSLQWCIRGYIERESAQHNQLTCSFAEALNIRYTICLLPQSSSTTAHSITAHDELSICININ